MFYCFDEEEKELDLDGQLDFLIWKTSFPEANQISPAENHTLYKTVKLSSLKLLITTNYCVLCYLLYLQDDICFCNKK